MNKRKCCDWCPDNTCSYYWELTVCRKAPTKQFMKPKDLMSSKIAGILANRKDIEDSSAYAKQLSDEAFK